MPTWVLAVLKPGLQPDRAGLLYACICERPQNDPMAAYRTSLSASATSRAPVVRKYLMCSNAIIADLDTRGSKVVISQHSRRTSPQRIDKEMYKWRHLIENFFCKLKEFKRIAMRADKTDQSFAAMIQIAATVMASR
jgi:transposase